jgi:hypothetical protein
MSNLNTVMNNLFITVFKLLKQYLDIAKGFEEVLGKVCKTKSFNKIPILLIPTKLMYFYSNFRTKNIALV